MIPLLTTLTLILALLLFVVFDRLREETQKNKGLMAIVESLSTRMLAVERECDLNEKAINMLYAAKYEVISEIRN